MGRARVQVRDLRGELLVFEDGSLERRGSAGVVAFLGVARGSRAVLVRGFGRVRGSDRDQRGSLRGDGGGGGDGYGGRGSEGGKRRHATRRKKKKKKKKKARGEDKKTESVGGNCT